MAQRAHHAAGGRDQQQDRDRAEPAGVVERVVDGALEPRAVGVLAERDVVEHRGDDAPADVLVVEEQPEAADEQHRQRHEAQHREERDLRGVAVAAVVDELHARPPEREQRAVRRGPRAFIRRIIPSSTIR